MRKILIFSLAYYPHVGGAEVAIKEITDRISNIEFHMVTMRFSRAEKEEEKIGNVYVYRIGNGANIFNKFLFQLRASKKASQLHAHNHFDAVWAMMAHSAGVPAAMFKQKYPHVPMVLTLQEGDPPKQIERTMMPLWPFFTRAFTSADRVTAISTFLADWAKQRGSKNIVIIPNGADIKTFAGEPVAHDGFVLVTTSRLYRKNAIDDVIRALPMLPDSVRFLVLGSGPEEIPLKALAKKEGVGARVEFKGYVEHKDMPPYLHAADLFIRPSRSEGQGASFIEAMAAGLPVIATMVGGIPDFLKDGETGYAVEVNNPKSIADAVLRAMNNADERRAIAHNAKELSKRYDWDMLARRMDTEAFEPLWQK